MPKPKCTQCGKNPAKRFCPALDRNICPVCCGTSRMKTIDCPKDCGYLGNESYQTRVSEEKELSELLRTVPHGKFDDILQESDGTEIAYAFESMFAECYVKGLYRLDDQKVKEALALLYFVTQRKKPAVLDEFGRLMLDKYNLLLRHGYDEEYIGTVMLRLIISEKSMSGGLFGPCGYLNYLKNNTPTDIAEFRNDIVVEDKQGRSISVPKIPKPGSRSNN